MKVKMTQTIQMYSTTLNKGEEVTVFPHETIPNVFYVDGLTSSELLLNEPQIFVKVIEKAA
jgi:hypothetical protein